MFSLPLSGLSKRLPKGYLVKHLKGKYSFDHYQYNSSSSNIFCSQFQFKCYCSKYHRSGRQFLKELFSINGLKELIELKQRIGFRFYSNFLFHQFAANGFIKQLTVVFFIHNFKIYPFYCLYILYSMFLYTLTIGRHFCACACTLRFDSLGIFIMSCYFHRFHVIILGISHLVWRGEIA